MSSCILYKNADSTILLVDIPRSIEVAQGDASCKILSSKPLERPYPSCEPVSPRAFAKFQQSSLDNLLLQKHLELALSSLLDDYKNEQWCLPRALDESVTLDEKRRQKRMVFVENNSRIPMPEGTANPGCLHCNIDSAPRIICPSPSNQTTYLPPNSTALCGDITSTKDLFHSLAPQFPLIILDPPWPNRSARRKDSYGICYNEDEINSLLLSISIQNHLVCDGGLIAIWITNKEAIREMVIGENGLFEAWGVHLIEEWIWVKVTTKGEPICPLNGVWRKPYEVLLVGRRVEERVEVTKRVIVAVPDLHSRKPNLKVLFQEFRMLPQDKNGSVISGGLEIFARNLTAGWWGWGIECLKFETENCWEIAPNSKKALEGEEPDESSNFLKSG